jgi:RNA polymerase sigma-70 factor (ECF subfamily)
MDHVSAPIQPVGAAGARGRAVADAAVVAAWADHHGELYAFLVRTTRDREVAEDLLQESFLRLTREVHAGRAPDNVRAWLYRVAANLATSRGRRIATSLRALVRIAPSTSAARTDDPLESSYIHREGHAELLAALESLGPDARAALLLSSEGFGGTEIAAAIGRSEAATRTLLCRTRVRVRSILETAEASR